EAVAYPRPDLEGILANPTGEDQRVQATEGGSKGADPFLSLVTEQGDRLSGAHVFGFAGEQVAHIRADLGHPEQPGLVMDHFVELLAGHLQSPRQVPEQPGVQVAGAGAHGDAGSRGKAHASVNTLAVPDGGEAGAIAQVSEDQAPTDGFGAGESLQLAHEESVRETMKPEPLNAFGVEPPRDGQQLRHAGHVPVKSGIKAGHLWQSRMAVMEYFHELDAGRHVLWVIRADPVQLGHQSRGDALRLAQLEPAVDDAVADARDVGEPDMMFQPADEIVS